MATEHGTRLVICETYLCRSKAARDAAENEKTIGDKKGPKTIQANEWNADTEFRQCASDDKCEGNEECQNIW